MYLYCNPWNTSLRWSQVFFFDFHFELKVFLCQKDKWSQPWFSIVKNYNKKLRKFQGGGWRLLTCVLCICSPATSASLAKTNAVRCNSSNKPCFTTFSFCWNLVVIKDLWRVCGAVELPNSLKSHVCSFHLSCSLKSTSHSWSLPQVFSLIRPLGANIKHTFCVTYHNAICALNTFSSS